MSADSGQDAQATIRRCARVGWKVTLWGARYGYVTIGERWALTESGARRKAGRLLRRRRRQLKKLNDAYIYREVDL